MYRFQSRNKSEQEEPLNISQRTTFFLLQVELESNKAMLSIHLFIQWMLIGHAY